MKKPVNIKIELFNIIKKEENNIGLKKYVISSETNE